jgi:hypothetical protein
MPPNLSGVTIPVIVVGPKWLSVAAGSTQNSILSLMMWIYPLTFSTGPSSSVIVNVPLTVVELGPSWSTAVWAKSDTS